MSRTAPFKMLKPLFPINTDTELREVSHITQRERSTLESNSDKQNQESPINNSITVK